MIPFMQEREVRYGVSEELSPLVRRVMARNPGPFTYLGTGTYIVGRGEVAVIDPGPDLPEHLEALRTALAGERVTDILVTHTHMDHSPLAHPLAAVTGAVVRGLPAPGVEAGFEEADEGDFRPDRLVAEGERIAGGDLHARPHVEPRRLCAPGGERPLSWRPRHGLVDHRRQPAGRRHDRLSR
jgi:glyoxylase-like metal-dependent hydrolase (beta-lactamase superfamily II)